MDILHLITSSRGQASLSNKLGNSIVQTIQQQFSDTKVKERNLASDPIPHLDEVHLTSFFTPREDHTPEFADAVKYSDRAIEELMKSSIVVIDVPMYNFTIPSVLKAWIDHTTRTGVTFNYTANGVEGLVKNKQVILAISSGGIYTEGVMKDFDFTENYLRQALGFIGISDITVFRVEGSGMPETKDTALPKAIKAVEEFTF